VLVDKDGNYAKLPGWVAMDFNFASSLTTDVDGSMYFTAPSGTYGLKPDGSRKWAQLEGGVVYGEGQPGAQMGTALALAPDGVLYGVSSDLQLRAFRSADGAVLWRRSLGLAQDAPYASSSVVLGGAGNAVFVRIGVQATSVVDGRDGSELGRLRLADGTDLAGSPAGWALSYHPRICMGLWLFDTCGHLVSSRVFSKALGGPAGGMTIGILDQFAVSTWNVDATGNPIPQTDQIALYDMNGSVALGPKPGKGGAVAVGADGTLYTVNCKYTNPQENRLYAYSPDLDELWHLDLGKTGYCPTSKGVLDDDGVLYLAIDNEYHLGSDIMAIQTQSPGLAPSAWPMIRHDNRGTMWLVPATPAPVTNDGADTADASTADAPPDVPASMDSVADVADIADEG
jgi:outer membrane protein assembly factor BamB